jgi:Raf kinase inhibitor-like YbhB/YbcL family protein
MRVCVALLAGCLMNGSHAFELTSADIHNDQPLAKAQVHKRFGCHGGNLAPALSWSDVPAGTKSFAITLYDPDAIAGSGWWHWLVYDIPAAVTALPGGASDLPASARQGRNDYTLRGFNGACPPRGQKHRFVFTVHALKVDKLDVADDAGGAIIGAALRKETLGEASITTTYSRE